MWDSDAPGCLGLIVVAVASGLVWYFYTARYRSQTGKLQLFNPNPNLIPQRTPTRTTDDSNDSIPRRQSSSSASDGWTARKTKSTSSYRPTMTRDIELIRRVKSKLGLMDDDFTPGEKYAPFRQSHQFPGSATETTSGCAA